MVTASAACVAGHGADLGEVTPDSIWVAESFCGTAVRKLERQRNRRKVATSPVARSEASQMEEQTREPAKSRKRDRQEGQPDGKDEPIPKEHRSHRVRPLP
jgi:hypothetical protein